MTGVHLGHKYDILKCSNRFSSLHYLVNVPFRKLLSPIDIGY